MADIEEQIRSLQLNSLANIEEQIRSLQLNSSAEDNIAVLSPEDARPEEVEMSDRVEEEGAMQSFVRRSSATRDSYVSQTDVPSSYLDWTVPSMRDDGQYEDIPVPRLTQCEGVHISPGRVISHAEHAESLCFGEAMKWMYTQLTAKLICMQNANVMLRTQIQLMEDRRLQNAEADPSRLSSSRQAPTISAWQWATERSDVAHHHHHTRLKLVRRFKSVRRRGRH